MKKILNTLEYCYLNIPILVLPMLIGAALTLFVYIFSWFVDKTIFHFLIVSVIVIIVLFVLILLWIPFDKVTTFAFQKIREIFEYYSNFLAEKRNSYNNEISHFLENILVMLSISVSFVFGIVLVVAIFE